MKGEYWGCLWGQRMGFLAEFIKEGINETTLLRFLRALILSTVVVSIG
jgi:hypothetical protein